MTDQLVALVVAVPMAVVVADALADRFAFSLPTGVKHAPHAHPMRDIDRRDPVYDGPPEWHELRSLQLWVEALVVFAAICVFIVLASLVWIAS